jgi:hypothetical protein
MLAALVDHAAPAFQGCRNAAENSLKTTKPPKGGFVHLAAGCQQRLVDQ